MRIRLACERWLRIAVVLVGGLSAFLAMIACLRFLVGVLPVSAGLLALWMGVVLLAVLISRLFVRVSTKVAAACLDDSAPGVEDRFRTWSALPIRGAAPSWNLAIRKEIETFAAGFRLPVTAMAVSRSFLALILLAWVGIAALQAWFWIDIRSNAADRISISKLLLSAAGEIESADPELSAFSDALKSEAEQIRQNRLQKPRDTGVRALSAAISGIRALADPVPPKDGLSQQPSQGARSNETDKFDTSGSLAAISELPITTDPSLSGSPSAPTLEESKRLERLASRLEEKRRSAAGLGDAPGSEKREDGGGDNQLGSSLLEQLAAGNNPSAPGPVESDSAAPGPGSDNDFGSAQTNPEPTGVLDETTGPELSARVPNSENEAGSSFSITSRQSGNASQVPVSTPSTATLEFNEQTVELEEIPIGARELVLRYFESVRAGSE
ncbi:MAG: hypothetical protein ACOVMP_04405 [Chthoniobacterales bacterium]